MSMKALDSHGSNLMSTDTCQEKRPPVRAEWRQSCKDLHPDWDFRLWNLTAMEVFLREMYPWFLPTFLAYPADIHKGHHPASSHSRQQGTQR